VSGTLAARDERTVLNVAQVETARAGTCCSLRRQSWLRVETYLLSRLLRGLHASEPEMLTGAFEGARSVFLTEAEVRLEEADGERGLVLLWRAEALEGTATHPGAAGRVRSPAHLTARCSGGDMMLDWIRRARKGGDPSGPGEPPHEVDEAYRVRVSSSGGVLRSWDVAGATALYTAGQMAADFPAGGIAGVAVAQLGADGQPGDWAEMTVSVPAP